MKIGRRELVKYSFISAVPMLMPLSSRAYANVDIPSAYLAIAEQYNIPIKILYAVALTESGIRIQSAIRPWPWTMNVEGEAYYFPTKLEATHAFDKFSKKTTSIDIGLMQINWHWHRERLGNFNSAISPLFNLHTGATILNECRRGSNDWWEAVGRYHAPGRDKTSKQHAEQYRARVKQQWANL